MTTNIISFPFRGIVHQPLWLPPVRNRRKPIPKSGVIDMAAVPPQFRVLRGSRTLLVADDDNLRLSCEQKLSASFSYRSLAAALQTICAKVELHAVLTSVEGQSARNLYFTRRGFHVLNVKREVVETASRRRVVPNDFDISFTVGAILARGGFNALLLGTGDGDLALAIARGARRIAPSARVYTLSVPGATSSRIHKEHSSHFIDANFFIDESMLRRPKAQSARSFPQKPRRRTEEGHHVA